MATKKATPKKPKLTPVEHVRPATQAWTDPISGDEVLLSGGVPSSGARIVDKDGEPLTTPIVADGDYYVVVD